MARLIATELLVALLLWGTRAKGNPEEWKVMMLN